MGVLPDRSKSIVPTAYHDLMTNPDSPIIDFYPRDFELDMNGKKMEWEAVVKIPFIDETRLLQAMRTRDHLLSKEERMRNEFGVSLKFTYSSEFDYVYPTPLAGIFPDLPHCHCLENIFDLPTMEGLDVHVGLVEGVKLGESALAGFPSLRTLPNQGVLAYHAVNVFQQDSRNESMIITMLDSDTRTKVEAAKRYLGRKVHVGYPYLAEAKVMKVSDELFDYLAPSSEGEASVTIPHEGYGIDAWRRKAERIENVYSKRYGIIIGHVESLVHVHMLKGLRKADDGATIKEYEEIPGVDTDYAAQMLVEEVVSEDQRFLEKAALPIEEEFPEGSRAFFLGEFNYGRPLEILKHHDNKADIWISTIKGKEADFGREIARDADRHTHYTPSFAVARMLGLNPLVLSKITSAFQVMVDDTRVNLGLNLKFESKKLKVLGYSRRGTSGWEFSAKAIQLLQQYMVNFPEFIAGIQRNPQGNIYEATDFFSEKEAKIKIREIKEWLKSIEARNFVQVPLDAEQLDSEVVVKIEKAADDTLRNGPPVEGKKIKSVPRNALLKPSDAEHRLGNQRFSVGDRVVYIQDSGRVPIATRGTVVGLTRTSRALFLDCVFDVTFMSGTTLGDRCSPFRGSSVQASSVLNLTDRQVVAGSKAAEEHKATATVQPFTATNGAATAGMLRPASVPAPLRGSFRGAVSGQSNGPSRGGMAQGRGEHGPPNGRQNSLPVRDQDSPGPHGGRGNHSGRGRYQPIDLGEAIPRDNPNFKPQSYNNVPPPTNLDMGRRGRGRGGVLRANVSRGRGGRGRGSVAVE